MLSMSNFLFERSAISIHTGSAHFLFSTMLCWILSKYSAVWGSSSIRFWTDSRALELYILSIRGLRNSICDDCRCLHSSYTNTFCVHKKRQNCLSLDFFWSFIFKPLTPALKSGDDELQHFTCLSVTMNYFCDIKNARKLISYAFLSLRACVKHVFLKAGEMDFIFKLIIQGWMEWTDWV